jgi:Lysyl oxidase
MAISKRRRSLTAGTGLIAAAALVGALAVSTAGTTSALAATRPAASGSTTGPVIKLIAASRKVTAYRFGKYVYIDPGIWVASLQSAFQLNVGRASYTKPITVTQVIRTPHGVVRRPLSSRILSGWNGLRHFAGIVIRNASGKVVSRRSLTFCPDNYELSKATTNSAQTSVYPQQCQAYDPFSLGEVWGIPRGWAVDPVQYSSFKLGVGKYRLTMWISPNYARLFHVSKQDRTATVQVKVERYPTPGKASRPSPNLAAVPANFVRVAARKGAARTLPSFPAAKTLSHPPVSAEPDLVPLPSWGITLTHQKKGDRDFLNFAATVWIGGNGPLDVEGFRSNGSGTMTAYQYFYKNGKLVGKARVGTMGFANYNAWHFKQFAEYRLLNTHRQIAIRSKKVSFCIAPTDGVDMLLRHAVWQPSYTGISGNCGDPTALWVTETLPLGWGDTYVQTVPYQNFDITHVPNGTYYIEIIANPEGLLYETNRNNDVSLRRIILGGTRGHRTVRVPAWHGIDFENGHGYGYF